MFNKEVQINNISIGPKQTPYIVAEMSGNHNQSIDRALKLIEEAAKTGVQAIKIQTYTPETMTLDINKAEFCIKNEFEQWSEKNLFQLYKEAHTPWEWHKDIFEFAKEKGITCFSSPFDSSAVELLESLNAPAYKIASFELTDLPLIKLCAETMKPIIISTGMGTLNEIYDAVETVEKTGNKNLVLLKCTSSYPAPHSQANLATIKHMSETFNCLTGLSDHTLGLGTSIAAIALGAVFIEKHFTLRRADGGVDSSFSLEPEEFTELVAAAKQAHSSVGSISYGCQTEAAQNSRKFRRSLYFVKDVKKGETIQSEHIRAIRPGYGLKPKYLDKIIGKTLKQDVTRGTATTWELI
ncbi:MAG: pseudaminic acid synthase [Bdellovibrionales bacterium]|nr:pseudaminic acid synthase [Bdellovibrionales bacterium]